jgi:hypothetical protein
MREDVSDAVYEQLRQKESSVVTSAMCALAGGLGILLSGGLCGINDTLNLWCFPVIPSIYVASAILLFGSVLRYVFTQRNWPRDARRILKGSCEGAN